MIQQSKTVARMEVPATCGAEPEVDSLGEPAVLVADIEAEVSAVEDVVAVSPEHEVKGHGPPSND